MPSALVATAAGLVVVDDGEHTEIDAREIRSVATGAGGSWAVADGHTVWHAAPGGPWSHVAMLEEREINCLLPRDSEVLLGTSESHLFALHKDQIEEVASFDAAPGRSEWFTPWGGPPDVRSMARSSSGDVFVNVHVGGILRSSDLDRWSPTIEISSDVHQVIVHDGLVLAATAWGLATSRDAGETWTFDRDGLHGSYARAVAVCGEFVLMSASEGPRGRHSALYRRSLDGGAFARCEEGLPERFTHNIDTGCLDGSGSQALFATEDGRVFASNDAGGTWSLVVSGLAAARAVALTSA